MAGGTFTTEPIIEADVGAGFSCGVPALDAFFARHALANDRRGLGRTFVRRRRADESDLPLVLGFYTLAMADVESTTVPLRGLPRYRAPVALIGRLAVDERGRGRGLGEELLIDAFLRVLDVEASIGCLGVIVDAKDEKAAGFYSKYGFVPLADAGWPRRMFVAMKTLRAGRSP